MNCLSADTEILTTRGWVKFSSLTQNDLVAQFDTESETIEFVKPLDYIESATYKKLLHISTDEQLDMLLTFDHDCLVQDRRTNKYRKVKAYKYPKDAKQPQAGTYYDGELEYSEAQIVLICAFQADGHIVKANGLISEPIVWTFYKKRKIERIKWALGLLGIPYTLKEVTRKSGFNTTLKDGVTIYVGANDVPDWLMGKKFFGPWITNLSRESLDYFVTEVFFWDGNWNVRNQYASCVKNNADWVQIAMVLSNIRANIIGWQPKEPNRQVSWQVLVSHKPYSMTTNYKVEDFDYDDKVYCVRVPTGCIITRRNNKVCITGNCSKHTAIGQLFRGIIEAPAGYTFVEFDKKSFHVATMGYAANDSSYIRFSQLDPHSIFSSYIMPKEWGKPIDLSLGDADILDRCKWIKKRCKQEKEKDPIHGINIRQDCAKPTVLGNQLGLGARKLHRMNRRFIASEAKAKEYQETLAALFPKVEAFKEDIRLKAHNQTYLLLEEWGKICYFFDVFNWRFDKRRNQWIRGNGGDSEKAIAFPVQGHAFGMIDSELFRIDNMGGCLEHNYLLSIHDSLVFMPEIGKLDKCIEMVVGEMNKPCDKLVNKATEEVAGEKGAGLKVAVEVAIGRNWRSYDKESNPEGMQEVKN